MLKYVYSILGSEGKLVGIGELDHGVRSGLRKITMDQPADRQRLFKVAARFIVLLKLLASIGK